MDTKLLTGIYYNRFSGYASRLGESHEDLLQEIFLHFLDKDLESKYDPERSNFKTYAAMIIRTFLTKRVRARSALKNRQAPDYYQSFGITVSSQTGPDESRVLDLVRVEADLPTSIWIEQRLLQYVQDDTNLLNAMEDILFGGLGISTACREYNFPRPALEIHRHRFLTIIKREGTYDEPQ